MLVVWEMCYLSAAVLNNADKSLRSVLGTQTGLRSTFSSICGFVLLRKGFSHSRYNNVGEKCRPSKKETALLKGCKYTSLARNSTANLPTEPSKD